MVSNALHEKEHVLSLLQIEEKLKAGTDATLEEKDRLTAAKHALAVRVANRLMSHASMTSDGDDDAANEGCKNMVDKWMTSCVFSQKGAGDTT